MDICIHIWPDLTNLPQSDRRFCLPPQHLRISLIFYTFIRYLFDKWEVIYHFQNKQILSLLSEQSGWWAGDCVLLGVLLIAGESTIRRWLNPESTANPRAQTKTRYNFSTLPSVVISLRCTLRKMRLRAIYISFNAHAYPRLYSITTTNKSVMESLD